MASDLHLYLTAGIPRRVQGKGDIVCVDSYLNISFGGGGATSWKVNMAIRSSSSCGPHGLTAARAQGMFKKMLYQSSLSLVHSLPVQPA